MRIAQFVTSAGTMIGALIFAPLSNGLSAQQPAPHSASAAGGALLLPYPLAANVALRMPGTSRFAGEYRGVDVVTVALEALCATSAVGGAQAFVAMPEGANGADAAPASERRLTNDVSGGTPGVSAAMSESSPASFAGAHDGAFVLLRTAREGRRLLAWHEVLVFRLDSTQRIASIELYVEDQRAWDRRYPREDGVSRVSVVTERNVAAARGRVREARFVAGNADRVVAVIDAPRERGHAATQQGTRMVQETIAPSGVVRERLLFVSVPLLVGARD